MKRGIAGGHDVPGIAQGVAQPQIQVLRLNIAPVGQVAAPEGEPAVHQQQTGVIERVQGQIQAASAHQLPGGAVAQRAGGQRQRVVALQHAGVGQLRGVHRQRFPRQPAVVKQLRRRQREQVLAEQGAGVVQPAGCGKRQGVQRLNAALVIQACGVQRGAAPLQAARVAQRVSAQGEGLTARHLPLSLVREGVAGPGQRAAALKQAAVLQVAPQGQHFRQQLAPVIGIAGLNVQRLLAEHLTAVGQRAGHRRRHARFPQRVTGVHPLAGGQVQGVALHEPGVVKGGVVQAERATGEQHARLQVAELCPRRRQRAGSLQRAAVGHRRAVELRVGTGHQPAVGQAGGGQRQAVPGNHPAARLVADLTGQVQQQRGGAELAAAGKGVAAERQRSAAAQRAAVSEVCHAERQGRIPLDGALVLQAVRRDVQVAGGNTARVNQSSAVQGEPVVRQQASAAGQAEVVAAQADAVDFTLVGQRVAFNAQRAVGGNKPAVGQHRNVQR